MQLEDHAKRDKKKCKLSQTELDQLIDYYGKGENKDYQKKLAVELMALCGLRSNEAVAACMNDIRRLDDNSGYKLRVPTETAKAGYRETYLPDDLRDELDMYADMKGLDKTEPIIGVTTRTLRRWIDNAANALAEQTGNDEWENVTAHDMRRTWGNLCVEADMIPTTIQQMGGWETWEVFEENYLQSHSDRVIGEEARKLHG